MKRKHGLKGLAILVVILTLVMGLASCAEMSPSDVVNAELEGLQDIKDNDSQFDKGVKMAIKEDDKMSDDELDEFYQTNIIDTGLRDSLVEMICNSKYKVKDEKIEGDKATVKVVVDNKKYGDAFLKAGEANLDGYLQGLVDRAMNGEDVNDENIIAATMKFFGENLKTALETAENGYKRELTLKLKKGEDGWEVSDSEDMDFEMMDALVGGLGQGLDDLTEIMSEK